MLELLTLFKTLEFYSNSTLKEHYSSDNIPEKFQ